MEETKGGEPRPEQPIDPYGGSFAPASGVGPTITPQGTGIVGGWTPPPPSSNNNNNNNNNNN